MKKMLSLLTVAALLAQSADVSAMDTARRYGRGARALPGQMYRLFGQYVGAPMREQTANLTAWAGPFLSEVGTAIQARNFQALPGIVRKYKAQSGAVGVIAVAIIGAITLMIRALLKSSEGVLTVVKVGLKQELTNRGVNLTEKEKIFINIVEMNDVLSLRNFANNPQLLQGVGREVVEVAQKLVPDDMVKSLLKQILKQMLPTASIPTAPSQQPRPATGGL